jgi:hypothetical protein
MEDHNGAQDTSGLKRNGPLRRQITFAHEHGEPLDEAVSETPIQSIDKFRKVANTLADEALRRRRGLSVTALNEALSKLPSIWSKEEVQARELPSLS